MDRSFIPEVAVGFFQMNLTDGLVHNLATDWAAASGGTLPDINKYQYVLIIDCEGANARYRTDGVVPTAAIGNRILQDTQFIYTAASKSTMNFIQETAGSKLNIAFYRQTG